MIVPRVKGLRRRCVVLRLLGLLRSEVGPGGRGGHVRVGEAGVHHVGVSARR